MRTAVHGVTRASGAFGSAGSGAPGTGRVPGSEAVVAPAPPPGPEARGVEVPSTRQAAPPAYNSQRAARRTGGRSPALAPSCAWIGRCPFEPANSGGAVPAAANGVVQRGRGGAEGVARRANGHAERQV